MLFALCVCLMLNRLRKLNKGSGISNLDAIAEQFEDASFQGPKYLRPLQNVQWQRIILDEGHELANPNTSKYKNILELEAKSRWILSATPFKGWNAFFNLLRMLHFPLYHLMSVSLENFKTCLQDSFRAHLIRPVLEHAFASLMCGNSAAGSSSERGPIAFINHFVNFETADQKELYELLRKQAAIKFQAMVSSGTMESKPMQARANLRPLRRAAAGCGAYFTPREIEQNIESQGKWFLLPQGSKKQRYQVAPEDAYGNIDTDECSICLEALSNPLQTKCRHLFCEECILASLNVVSKCPQCRQPLSSEENEEKYTRDLYLPKLPLAATNNSSSGVEKKPSGKAEAVEPSLGSGDRVVMRAKMNALIQILLKLQQEEPGAKSIVFSQFSESMDNLSHLLADLRIKHATIRGSYPQKKRSETGVCMFHLYVCCCR